MCGSLLTSGAYVAWGHAPRQGDMKQGACHGTVRTNSLWHNGLRESTLVLVAGLSQQYEVLAQHRLGYHAICE